VRSLARSTDLGTGSPSRRSATEKLEHMSRDQHTVALATLGQVVATLGPGLLSPMTTRRFDDVSVRGVVVFDPVDPQPLRSGDLVLAIGMDPSTSEFADLITAAAAAGAAGVVVKVPRHWDERQLTPEPLVSVLIVAVATPWTHLLRLLQQAIDVAETSGSLEPTDLFALANVIARTVGGPVTIEDTASRVLAYSAVAEGDIDEPPTHPLLGRQVPEHYLEILRSRGVFRALQHARGVVHVDADESIGLRRRLAIGVRAGDELLGYLWVAEGKQPLREDAERALLDAARLASVHFVRARSAVESAAQARQDLLRELLDRRADPLLIAREFGVDADQPAAVIGVNLPTTLAADGAGHRGIAEMLLTYSSAYRWDIAVLDAGTHLMAVLFGLTAEGDRVTAGIRRLGVSLRDSADSAGTPVQVALGPVVPTIADLHRSRETVDWMLRALRADLAVARQGRPRPGSVVVGLEDIRALVTLEQVSDILAAHREIHGGPVARLHTIDQRRGTDYMSTLAAWLEAAGDVPKAARQVSVHPNTFRYRLRSISRMTGLDLENSKERVVAAVHLHLLDRGVLQTDLTED
jgi:DNA-binding PucR family transcriptional regulator